MKNHMKKIIIAVLLLLIIAALPITSWAGQNRRRLRRNKRLP